LNGSFSTISPYQTSGNSDTKYFTKGAKLDLPVEYQGTLFSMGDEEVCGATIEHRLLSLFV
jgi:acetamidase/formamidase